MAAPVRSETRRYAVADPTMRRLLQYLGLASLVAAAVLMMLFFYTAARAAPGQEPPLAVVILALPLLLVGGAATFLGTRRRPIHEARA